MTIIITKFNYAYETKKTNYRRGERPQLPPLDGDLNSTEEREEGDEVDNSFWYGGQRYSVLSCPT